MAGLAWLAILLRFDAFISPFGTGLIGQTSTSRIGYGLARNHYYPQFFARTDENGVPWVSLILSFLLGLVFCCHSRAGSRWPAWSLPPRC